MYIINEYGVDVAFCIVTMVCWGSWANTSKISTKDWPFPMFYWVAPRSGLASRWGITVTNAPGTVDPDYRGEAGVLTLGGFDDRQDSFCGAHACAAGSER